MATNPALRILLVGDPARHLMAHLPETDGRSHVVDSAGCRAELLRKLDGEPYDLVLADSAHDLNPVEVVGAIGQDEIIRGGSWC